MLLGDAVTKVLCRVESDKKMTFISPNLLNQTGKCCCCLLFLNELFHFRVLVRMYNYNSFYLNPFINLICYNSCKTQIQFLHNIYICIAKPFILKRYALVKHYIMMDLTHYFPDIDSV